jgi:hypothetical protein
MQRHITLLAGLLLGSTLLWGCSPKIQVSVPNEPININLNVKIEHKILIKVDRVIDDLLNDKSGLF